jgi:cytoskeleton protein RodZ
VSVGSTLAAARAARGLSVEELSAATRIRPHLIQGIEADDFAACGGDVYARGHVRALAKAVGLDATPLLAELAATGQALSSPVRTPNSDPSLVLRERRAAPGWMTAVAVLLGVVACLAALRLILPDGKDSAGGVTAKPLPTASTRPPSRTATRPTAPTRSYGDGSLSVSFAVTGDRCWISVKDSGGSTRLASILSQGQTATFRDDHKLSVVVGDVTAVTVKVNGREVSLGKGAGGVKRFTVRASDPLAAFGDSGSGTTPSRGRGA